MEAPPVTAGTFLDHYRKSGLIDDAGLAALPKELFDLPGREIAERLIAEGKITRWQADKLLAGKYKGFRLGKYQLLGLIGKGGMSAVYLGQHTVMRRRSAIKVLPSSRVNDASYLGRFHREAEAIASLNHNNIVRAYDVDVENTRNQEIHFLAMEYVDGPPLSQVVEEQGLLTFAEAVEIVRQTCEGLDHAHAAGLVHRDIKPSNLLVDKDGVVKILDLGLARFFDDAEEGSLTVAHDERVLGTADYLAPEQAVDSHTVDERADIYSLGCTVYYLLTGAPPFTDQSLAKRLLAHQTRSPEPLTSRRGDTPDSVEQLVAKMMEKRPDDRFASARELAEAAQAWLEDNHGHAPVSLRGLNDAEHRDRPPITLQQTAAPRGDDGPAGRSALSSSLDVAKEKRDTAFLKALNDSDINIIGIEDDDAKAKKTASPDDTSSSGHKTEIDPASGKSSPKQPPAKDPAAKGEAPAKPVEKQPPPRAPRPAPSRSDDFRVPPSIVKAPPPARRRRAGEQEADKKDEKKPAINATFVGIAISLIFVLIGVVILLYGFNSAAEEPVTVGGPSVSSTAEAEKAAEPKQDEKKKLSWDEARKLVIDRIGQEAFDEMKQPGKRQLIQKVIDKGPEEALADLPAEEPEN